MSPVVKAGFWFTVSNFLVKGISLITTPIFTRILPADEYGLISQYVAIQQLIVILATWDISYGAYQKGLFKYKDDNEFFNASSIFFTNMMTVIVFGLLFFLNVFYKEYILIPLNSLFVLFIYVMLQPAYRNWTVSKQKEFEYWPVVLSSLLLTFGCAIGAITSLLLIEKSAEVKFITELMCSVLFFIPFYIRQTNFKDVFRNFKKTLQYMVFIVKFQFPCVLHSLSLIILGQADRLMIGHMVGNSEAAFYSIAYNLANVMSILQSSLDQAMTPWRYKKLECGDYEAIRRNTNVLLVLVVAIMSSFVIVAPEIMKILFPKEYFEAVWCIPPVVLGVYFCFLYSIFVSIEVYYEKTWYILIVSSFCSIVNIILNYVAIDLFGYIACSYTTLISYILFAVGHFMFSNRIIRQNITGERIFDIRGIVCISSFGSLLMLGIMCVYRYFIVRYMILALIGIICFIFRNKIKQIIELRKSE